MAAALPMLHGVVMELEDCAFPLLRSVVATADYAEAFSHVDYAILVGAMPRKDGMERSDLLKANVSIFKARTKKKKIEKTHKLTLMVSRSGSRRSHRKVQFSLNQGFGSWKSCQHQRCCRLSLRSFDSKGKLFCSDSS